MSLDDDAPLPEAVAGSQIVMVDDAMADHLELAFGGAYAIGARYLDAADREVVTAQGKLVDGTPWELPLALHLSADASPVAAGAQLVLTDPEGVPLALLSVTEVTEKPSGGTELAGALTPLRRRSQGAFARLRLPAEQVRYESTGPVLAVPTERHLHAHDVRAIRELAERTGSHVLILALTSAGRGAEATALVRSLLSVVGDLGVPSADVRVVPLPRLDALPPSRQVRFAARVSVAYGADRVLLPHGADAWGKSDPADWLPVPVHRGPPGPLDEAQLAGLLDMGSALPEGFTSGAVERELRRAHPPLRQRGLVVLFTGLSGSGKSTVAGAVAAALTERTDRRITLLDGDIVRTMLSAGLGFSREHRELSVRRIGFVAAEIARHGGTVLCAPIAPYAASRAEVRRMVAQAGATFVLVHVATPLEICEARDRKGLYARARAGLIPEFTGVSDPYEVPDDAHVKVDTSISSLEQCVERVVALLADERLIEHPSTS